VPKTKRRRRPVEEPLPEAAALPRYIESSALVAALLEHDAEALAALQEVGNRVTSALTFTEAARAVLRARIERRITAKDEVAAQRGLETFARRCQIVEVSKAVLTRAGRQFPVEPVRALDAIHLATIEVLNEAPQMLTVVTRDLRVARNARALGYAVA
jgi:predicted nucleic acid-binding protein